LLALALVSRSLLGASTSETARIAEDDRDIGHDQIHGHGFGIASGERIVAALSLYAIYHTDM
jgi:hypothetical protein